MKVLKKIDWQARGATRVRWRILAVPENKTAADFKKEAATDGWEVVGETHDAAKRPALFLEMDAAEYDAKFKKGVVGENLSDE